MRCDSESIDAWGTNLLYQLLDILSLMLAERFAARFQIPTSSKQKYDLGFVSEIEDALSELKSMKPDRRSETIREALLSMRASLFAAARKEAISKHLMRCAIALRNAQVEWPSFIALDYASGCSCCRQTQR